MKKRKILIALVAVAIFFQVGLMFRIPVKTNIVEHHINDPLVIYKTTTEQVGLLNCESTTTHGVGIYTETIGSGPVGELIEIIVSLCTGNGETYVEVSEQLIATDFQEDLEDIRDYAEYYTGKSLAKKDLFITFNANAQELSGTSAGSAMTVALIAIIENKTLVEGTVLTGGISGSGQILSVEELGKKIQVAEDGGMTQILVPQTQCNQVPEDTEIEVVCVPNIENALEYIVD